MVADFVIEDIEDIERDTGRRVPSREVVRLNALGLRGKAAENKNAATCLSYLPRVAAIAPGVFFRQPTIGHEIWLEKVEQIAADEYETILAVRAFALSRPPSALPDPNDLDALKAAMDEFAVKYADFTRDQIFAALDYVVRGANPCRGENPPAVKADGERLPDGTEGEDWKECVALGVLRDAQAVLWGIDQRELEAMTRQQVERLTREAYFFHGVDTTSHNYMADYQAARDEVRAKLEAEARAENDRAEKEG